MIEYDLFHRLYRRHGQKWGATRCPNQRSASQSVNITPHSSQSVHPRSPSAVLVFRTTQNWMNKSVSKTTVTAQRRGCSSVITMNMDFICEARSPRSTHTHSYTPRCVHTSSPSPCKGVDTQLPSDGPEMEAVCAAAVSDEQFIEQWTALLCQI